MNYGRYQIMEELGSGSIGIVYKAHDPQIDREVALKVLRPDRVTSEDIAQRFLKEAKAIGRLCHPNIVSVYDVGRDHGTIYIAMELLEGVTLKEAIQNQDPDFKKIISLGGILANALDYAHQKGVVHRDIKPTNIILTSTGQVKITDFGIARIEGSLDQQQTQVGVILGTPAYMSPEQVKGQKVDKRSDLFSLGVILYELCTGRRPFAGDGIAVIFRAIIDNTPVEPQKINGSIPPRLSGLIMKSLNKSPELRFQTGREMAETLRQCFMDFEQQDSFGSSSKMSKKGGFLALLFVVMISVVGGASYKLFTRNKPEQMIPVTGRATKPAEKSIPPQKPEAKPVALQVESMPTGAQIFLNGTFRGTTPVDLQLPFGKYEVRLSLPNYYEWEAQVQLDKEGKSPLFVKLIPME